MITKSMIIKGLYKGIIQLIPCPDDEEEIVCKIGQYWFYFDDKNTMTILDKIIAQLIYFSEDEIFETEYDYYYAVLSEMEK